MRGYFAIGVEGLSKPMNFGNLMRSAHAFGAAFFFTVDAAKSVGKVPASDTSRATDHLPYYAWHGIDEMQFPQKCKLVGVELTDDAVDLASFAHPLRAAYVLGPERGSLSPEISERCDHMIKIPTKFCINVATAGAIVMYDRVRHLGSAGLRSAPSRLIPKPNQKSSTTAYGGPLYAGGRQIQSKR